MSNLVANKILKEGKMNDISKRLNKGLDNQTDKDNQSMNAKSETKVKAQKNVGGRQIKATLSATDANFLKQIAKKLGISEQDVIRKGVKLMNLYSDVYDKPNAKLVIETDDTRQDIMIL